MAAAASVVSPLTRSGAVKRRLPGHRPARTSRLAMFPHRGAQGADGVSQPTPTRCETEACGVCRTSGPESAAFPPGAALLALDAAF